MGDNQTGYISNNSDAITFEYKNEHGELVSDPNLEVISFGYRADGSLKWLDVFDTSNNKVTRYNACVQEDIVYIHWGGQYVWTDINCQRLEVGGAEYEELVDTVDELDANALRKQNNLNDVENKQTSLRNLESSAASPTSAADYGYDSTNQSSQSDVMVLTKWGGGIPMKVPFKEFSEAVHDAVGDPLPIGKGGTNAQDADNAILNLIQGATSIRDDAVRDDTEIPCFTGSAYAQGSHFGKVSLLKIFNNWLKSKFQSWLGITVTESGGSITGRSFSGEAATVASITRVTEDEHQVDSVQQQTGVTYTVTFYIPTGKIFIGYRFDIRNLSGCTLDIESSYKVTRNQIIISVKYNFQYGGSYPTITTVAMFCGQ